VQRWLQWHSPSGVTLCFLGEHTTLTEHCTAVLAVLRGRLGGNSAEDLHSLRAAVTLAASGFLHLLKLPPFGGYVTAVVVERSHYMSYSGATVSPLTLAATGGSEWREGVWVALEACRDLSCNRPVPQWDLSDVQPEGRPPYTLVGAVAFADAGAGTECGAYLRDVSNAWYGYSSNARGGQLQPLPGGWVQSVSPDMGFAFLLYIRAPSLTSVS
jgi:hypothetical protein